MNEHMKAEKEKQIQEEVKQIFTDWLNEKKGRKTPERFAILQEMYSRNVHVDAETLFNDLKRKKISVSRASVYNTLELLVECNLVKRHHFQPNIAHFEKAYGNRQHDHLICIECSEVFEFCDPRMHGITSKMSQLLNFKVESHSLIIQAHCQGCNKPQSPVKRTK